MQNGLEEIREVWLTLLLQIDSRIGDFGELVLSGIRVFFAAATSKGVAAS